MELQLIRVPASKPLQLMDYLRNQYGQRFMLAETHQVFASCSVSAGLNDAQGFRQFHVRLGLQDFTANIRTR